MTCPHPTWPDVGQPMLSVYVASNTSTQEHHAWFSWGTCDDPVHTACIMFGPFDDWADVAYHIVQFLVDHNPE